MFETDGTPHVDTKDSDVHNLPALESTTFFSFLFWIFLILFYFFCTIKLTRELTKLINCPLFLLNFFTDIFFRNQWKEKKSC